MGVDILRVDVLRVEILKLDVMALPCTADVQEFHINTTTNINNSSCASAKLQI